MFRGSTPANNIAVVSLVVERRSILIDPGDSSIMKTPRLPIALLLVAAFAIANAALGQVNSNKINNHFSRSEWIRQRMHKARFSSGLLPVTSILPTATITEVYPSADLDPAAIEPIRLSHDLLASDILAQPGTQAEPYVDANPSNPDNVVACWQENRFRNGGARTLGFAVSTDGGLTWVDGLVPKLTNVDGGAWQKASDPWVAFGPNNRAYFSSLLFNESTPANAIGVSVSTDGGRNWGPPVEVYRSSADFNDKEAVVADTSPTSPFFGSVYVAWDINIGGSVNTTSQTLVVARSTDGGNSYSSPVTVREGSANVGVIPRVGPDGTLYLAWVGGSDSRPKLFFSKSTDGGRTWGKKRKLGKLRPVGVRNLRTGAGLPSFDVDPRTGDLFIACAEEGSAGQDQAILITSRDGGSTWSDHIPVSDGPADAPSFTVSVAVNDASEVAISYYSLRNDPQRSFLVDEYVQVSRTGGLTFEPSIRLTTASFDIRFAAQAGNAFFLGDYAGLTAAGRGFQSVWIGTSVRSTATGNLQPDAFASRVLAP